jgi:hypothetical protein
VVVPFFLAAFLFSAAARPGTPLLLSLWDGDSLLLASNFYHMLPTCFRACGLQVCIAPRFTKRRVAALSGVEGLCGGRAPVGGGETALCLPLYLSTPTLFPPSACGHTTTTRHTAVGPRRESTLTLARPFCLGHHLSNLVYAIWAARPSHFLP